MSKKTKIQKFKEDDLALGDILSKASKSSPNALCVLRQYNSLNTHDVNVSKLANARNTFAYLCTTATFLGLPTHDNKNKFLYKSKKQLLADHIILKLESFLPQICQVCKDSYKVDSSTVHCACKVVTILATDHL